MICLEGVGVALVTPFGSKGEIDFLALKKLLEHTKCVDYWVVNGTTGESPTTSFEEKCALLEFVVNQKMTNKEYASKKIVFGMGGNNTQLIIDQMEMIDYSHVDAILSVTPYYNKPNQKGLYRHYTVIADQCKKPIVLYNVPGRTGVSIEIETVLKLAQHENIIGIKEADDDLNRVEMLFNAFPDDFMIISGTDSLTHEFANRKGTGVISVLANALPEAFMQIIDSVKHDDHETALAVQESLLPLDAYMYTEGNPLGIKSLLKYLNVCSKKTRLPLASSSKSLDKDIQISYDYFLNSKKNN